MDTTQLRPSSPRIPLLAALGCLLVAVPALIGVTSTSAAAATGQITGLGGKCVDVAGGQQRQRHRRAALRLQRHRAPSSGPSAPTAPSGRSASAWT